jgi:hypothetical protein
LAILLTRIGTQLTILAPSDLAAKQLLHAPHLQLLLDVFFGHHISHCLDRKINSPIGLTERVVAEIYNDFIAQFRQAMRAKKLLRRELHNWGYGSQENVAELHAYLDKLLAEHGSLTVLQLRLFHTKERVGLITAPVRAQHRDLEGLRKSRALFFDRMRRKPALFTDDPGYIWSILPSLEGGYDLHLILLFNTAALQKVIEDKKMEAEQMGVVFRDHADQVGMYFVNTATGGKGTYLRGDRMPWLYGPDWVHGEVRAEDHIRCEKLKETLSYLAMRRALVRLKNEPPGKYFGMSNRQV